MREEVLVAGTGGQGVDSAGSILGHVVLAQGLEVSCLSMYSPEVRGGWVTSTVVMADDEVGSPILATVDSLLLFSQMAADEQLDRVRPGGLVVSNCSLVRPLSVSGCRLLEVPATNIAAELGNEQVTNIVMLGAYVKARGVLDLSHFEAALRAVLPPRHHKHIPLNLEAVRLGAEQAR